MAKISYKLGCIPFLTDNCICTCNESEVLVGGNEVNEPSVEAMLSDMLRQGRISEREYRELSRADQQYHKEQATHVLRPLHDVRTNHGFSSHPPPPPQKMMEHQPAKQKLLICENIVERDPISLEVLTEDHCLYEFKCYHNQQVVTVKYVLENLVSYLLASGDFREPTTRHPFSKTQLQELDCLVATSNLKLESLVEAFQRQTERYAPMRARRDMIEGLERCVGDVMSSIRDELENGVGGEELQVRLCTLFGEFDHLFDQLKAEDPALAKTCLMHYSSMIEGPPNKRCSDLSGMRNSVLRMLSEKSRDLTP